MIIEKSLKIKMDYLLQSQIQDSCRLALPNGLKELMNDISREVLRAQPRDVFKFISDYLSTLLVTRENLYIAAQVCSVVCDCDCRPELEDELRYIGLDEKVASEASVIIEEFLRTDEVNEGNLLLKLLKKTSIDETKLPAVLSAIRRSFLRHQKNHTQIIETSSNSDEDESERAVRHTIGIYRKTKPTTETFNCMARKIQASYRAYKVRREKETIKSIKTDQLSGTPSRSESIRSTDQATRSTDHVTSSRTENLEKTKVTFRELEQAKVIASDQALDTCQDRDLEQFKLDATLSKPNPMPSVTKLSSTSLAGSYLSLPQYKPYSAHDLESLTGLEEAPEKEHSNYDYTRENSPVNDQYINDMSKESKQLRDRKILFSESPEEGDSDTEESIEEVIEEEDIARMDNVQFIEGIVEQMIMGNDDVLDRDIAEYIIERGQGIANENIMEIDIVDDGIVEDNIAEEDITEDSIVDGIMDDIFEDDEDDNFGYVTGSY